ncbi:MAG: chlorophyll synthesis pathway protein BchC [Pseudomonadota bacterium]
MLNTPETSPPSGTNSALKTHAVVFSEPERLSVRALDLPQPGPSDLVVDIEWTGISTGTERLLFDGTMPPFPGLAYPLVPGYESVGRVVAAGADAGFDVDQRVFVSGANCYGDVRGLFGGAASRLVVPADKVSPLAAHIGAEGVLLALAATAHHAISTATVAPELIVGHGVLGRLLARLVVALGNAAPVVWEIQQARRTGAAGYRCVAPGDDERRDYRSVCDVSGDAAVIDHAVPRLARGGEIVLAGFYSSRVGFEFPPAFMREASIRIAAEWQPEDLCAVSRLVHSGELSLDGLITHRAPAADAASAYRTAFRDAGCLKMVLDWSDLT